MVSRRIYVDNAATSYPKPPAVLDAMVRYTRDLGASPGRGAYRESRQAGEILWQCRQRMARLVNAELPEHLVFAANATDALNLAIHGLLREGDHAITTRLDHNSVLRPLSELQNRGVIEQTRVACDPGTGLVDPDDIRAAMTPRTRLVVVAHGSNVSGTLQPIAEIAKVAHEAGAIFLVDAAQSVGHVPIDVRSEGIDLLACPGHKGLLGPLGTGVLYIRPGLEEQLWTLRQGGTGSASEIDVQPAFLPDKYEPGSHNALGIAGLSEGLAYLLERGVSNLWDHEQRLVDAMLRELDRDLPGLELFGPPGREHRCAVFSIRVAGFDQPQELSDALEERFGLLTRSGLHCAPLAHQTFGTYSRGGTTRLSFGAFNTEKDVAVVGTALETLCRERSCAA